MFKKADRKVLRSKRRLRIRARVRGTAERPRLSVFRSTRHIYAQIIDDDAGRTLVAASTAEPRLREGIGYGGNVEAARAVGREIAKRALEKGIKAVVFDRGGNLYHGRVAALAEGAREGGLVF